MKYGLSKNFWFTFILLSMTSAPTYIKANNHNNTAIVVGAVNEPTYQEEIDKALNIVLKWVNGEVKPINKLCDELLVLLSGKPGFPHFCELLRKMKTIKGSIIPGMDAAKIGDEFRNFINDPNKIQEIPAQIAQQIKETFNRKWNKLKFCNHIANCVKA